MKPKLDVLKKITTALNQTKRFKQAVGLVVSLVFVPLVGCGGGSNDAAQASAGAVPTAATAAAATAGTTTTVATPIGTTTASATPPIVTAPTIAVQPANITVTELQPASFSVAAAGGAPLAYQWRRNGATIVGATSATLSISSAIAADHNAKYSAVVTNSAGSATSTEAVLTQELPMFLMAGQSNMEGNIDDTLFKQLLADLATPTTDIKARLKERIRYWHLGSDGRAYPNYGYSDKMADLEASELMRLNAAGLVGANLTKPNPKIFCGWNDRAITQLRVSADEKTRCGNLFGPELVLGEALSKAGYSNTSLIKVAVGGTTLHADWRSPSAGGTPSSKDLYAKLRTRIQSLKDMPASVNPSCANRSCKWSALVWFQGENDAQVAEGADYEKNLKNFIADVRKDAGLPTLPVVIVQIGTWGQSFKVNNVATGIAVADAQTKVVKEDQFARIVTTSDLSGFYHYDPAAQLIIGDRVAQAVQSLLVAAPAAK